MEKPEVAKERGAATITPWHVAVLSVGVALVVAGLYLPL